MRFKPPVFADLILDVRKPVQEEINLSGKAKVEFGPNGQYLKNAGTDFIIRAIKENDKVMALLDATDSTKICLKKTGAVRQEAVFGEEKIFDSDTIIVDDYTIIVSSFSLTRE